MSNKFDTPQLEQALAGARRAFWINLFFIIINVVIYIIMSQAGSSTAIPLFVGGFCVLGALLANKSEKMILIQLGREDEI